MILVVFSHVEWASFDLKNSFINELFISFRMPLFFFISGFIGYKANVEWNKHTWWMMSKKKMLVQIIPTLVFGLTYTCLYLKVDPHMFVSSHTKMGYWFTIVLCEMFILVYTMNYVLHQCNSKGGRLIKLISITILTGLLFIARLIPIILPSCQNAFDILCLHQTINYLSALRACLRQAPDVILLGEMREDVFNKYLENKYMVAMTIGLFVILFYSMTTYLTPNKEGNTIIFFAEIIVEIIVGILGLLIIYNTFKTYGQNFTSEKIVGKALQRIGRRTLDIYLLHYFFLPYTPQIGKFLSAGNNSALELLIGGAISIWVIWICMGISYVIRTSPVLAKYLFGAKTATR